MKAIEFPNIYVKYIGFWGPCTVTGGSSTLEILTLPKAKASLFLVFSNYLTYQVKVVTSSFKLLIISLASSISTSTGGCSSIIILLEHNRYRLLKDWVAIVRAILQSTNRPEIKIKIKIL